MSVRTGSDDTSPARPAAASQVIQPTGSWPATGTVPLTDALIAVAAAEHGGLAVLHRDAHFDRLAEILAFQSVTLPGP